MDGADAATTFTDSETTPKTVTANGNAQIDTAQSKFGGASALFDGTGYRKVVVTHIASNGSFSAGDDLSVKFMRTGNKGTDGAGAGDVIGPDQQSTVA